MFLVHNYLPAFCASQKIPSNFVVSLPSYISYGCFFFSILLVSGLQDLLEEKDGSDVDAEAAALMLELRGSHERFVVGDGVGDQRN